VASDQDLRDIYAFLSSLPEPPKLKDIPLLNQ
jgi:cytochrome c1